MIFTSPLSNVHIAAAGGLLKPTGNNFAGKVAVYVTTDQLDAVDMGTASANSILRRQDGDSRYDLASANLNVSRLVGNTSTVVVLKSEINQPNGIVGLDESGYITLAGDPTSNLQPATMRYVDDRIKGLRWKSTVRAATTANITLSGTQTIDGVSLSVGQRVLVKNQSTASQNGIYVVASGSWTRAQDADSIIELVNASLFVEEGSTNADSAWTCTVNTDGVIGTTAIPWVQFAGASAYQPSNVKLTAFSALTPTGNSFAMFTGANTMALATLTPLTVNFLASDTEAEAKAALGIQEVSVGDALSSAAPPPTGFVLQNGAAYLNSAYPEAASYFPPAGGAFPSDWSLANGGNMAVGQHFGQTNGTMLQVNPSRLMCIGKYTYSLNWISTDEGETWQSRPFNLTGYTNNPFLYVQGAAADGNNTVVVIGLLSSPSTNAVVIRSVDAGNTFSYVGAISGNTVSQIIYHPPTSRFLAFDRNIIRISTDGGATWSNGATFSPSSDITGSYLLGSNVHVIAKDVAFVTTDGGSTVTSVTSYPFTEGQPGSLAYGNGYFVTNNFAHGGGNTIYYSTNGTTWTGAIGPGTSNAGTYTYGMVYANGVFCTSSGTSSRIFQSNSSGPQYDWKIIKEYNPGVTVYFTSAVAANNRFLATFSDNSFARSGIANANTQWPQFKQSYGEVTDVAYGNGTYIATVTAPLSGNQAAAPILISNSSTSGKWVSAVVPNTYYSQLKSIAYGNGVFVVTTSAQYSNSYMIMRSGDNGATWTRHDGVFANNTNTGQNTVKYVNNRFVVVCGNNTIIVSSNNANDWSIIRPNSAPTYTQSTSSLDSVQWYDIEHDSSKYILCGSNNLILTSNDLVTWNRAVVVGANNNFTFTSLTYDGYGKYIAGSGYGVYTSTDGFKWNLTSPLMSTDSWTINYKNGLYLVANTGQSQIYSSYDAQNWSTYTFSPALYGYGNLQLGRNAKVVGDRIVALGNNMGIMSASYSVASPPQFTVPNDPYTSPNIKNYVKIG